MALIEEDHPAAADSVLGFWQDQLKNTRILLVELDKAILKLERQEKESYTIDTGQTTITARRVDLPELINRRASLLKQLKDIEDTIANLTDPGGDFVQVVPY